MHLLSPFVPFNSTLSGGQKHPDLQAKFLDEETHEALPSFLTS